MDHGIYFIPMKHACRIIVLVILGLDSFTVGVTLSVEFSTCGTRVNIDKVEPVTLHYIGGNITRCKYEFLSTSSETSICWQQDGQPECTTSVEVRNDTGSILMKWSCYTHNISEPECSSGSVVDVVFSGYGSHLGNGITVRVYSQGEQRVEEPPIDGVDPTRLSVVMIVVVTSLLMLGLIAMVVAIVVCFLRERREKERKRKPIREDPFTVSPHDIEMTDVKGTTLHQQAADNPGFQPSPKLRNQAQKSSAWLTVSSEHDGAAQNHSLAAATQGRYLTDLAE